MRVRNNFLIYSSILIICLTQVSADLCDDFELFKNMCGRIYPPDEIEIRKNIYERRCK